VLLKPEISLNSTEILTEISLPFQCEIRTESNCENDITEKCGFAAKLAIISQLIRRMMIAGGMRRLGQTTPRAMPKFAWWKCWAVRGSGRAFPHKGRAWKRY